MIQLEFPFVHALAPVARRLAVRPPQFFDWRSWGRGSPVAQLEFPFSPAARFRNLERLLAWEAAKLERARPAARGLDIETGAGVGPRALTRSTPFWGKASPRVRDLGPRVMEAFLHDPELGPSLLGGLKRAQATRPDVLKHLVEAVRGRLPETVWNPRAFAQALRGSLTTGRPTERARGLAAGFLGGLVTPVVAQASKYTRAIAPEVWWREVLRGDLPGIVAANLIQPTRVARAPLERLLGTALARTGEKGRALVERAAERWPASGFSPQVLEELGRELRALGVAPTAVDEVLRAFEAHWRLPVSPLSRLQTGQLPAGEQRYLTRLLPFRSIMADLWAALPSWIAARQPRMSTLQGIPRELRRAIARMYELSEGEPLSLGSLAEGLAQAGRERYWRRKIAPELGRIAAAFGGVEALRPALESLMRPLRAPKSIRTWPARLDDVIEELSGRPRQDPASRLAEALQALRRRAVMPEPLMKTWVGEPASAIREALPAIIAAALGRQKVGRRAQAVSELIAPLVEAGLPTTLSLERRATWPEALRRQFEQAMWELRPPDLPLSSAVALTSPELRRLRQALWGLSPHELRELRRDPDRFREFQRRVVQQVFDLPSAPPTRDLDALFRELLRRAELGGPRLRVSRIGGEPTVRFPSAVDRALTSAGAESPMSQLKHVARLAGEQLVFTNPRELPEGVPAQAIERVLQDLKTLEGRREIALALERGLEWQGLPPADLRRVLSFLGKLATRRASLAERWARQGQAPAAPAAAGPAPAPAPAPKPATARRPATRRLPNLSEQVRQLVEQLLRERLQGGQPPTPPRSS